MRRALAFLTPLGGAAPPDATTMRWFPAAGAAIGGAVGVAWWAAGHGWRGAAVPAAIAVLADLVLTGMLHLDGLADSADGLLPHLERARRLEVMSQPDVGAFGVGAVTVVLLLRFAAFASIRPHVALVAGVWCASRSVMVLAAIVLPYARGVGGGLASAFLGDGRGVLGPIAGAGIVAGLGLAAWGSGWAGVFSVLALLLGAIGVLLLARARLGGFTGDVLGAAGVVGETVALVVAAARW